MINPTRDVRNYEQEEAGIVWVDKEIPSRMQSKMLALGMTCQEGGDKG